MEKEKTVVMYDSPEAAELKTVNAWVARTGEVWPNNEHMTDKALRQFIIQHPIRIDLRKIPAAHTPWFVDLLAGSRAVADITEQDNG